MSLIFQARVKMNLWRIAVCPLFLLAIDRVPSQDHFDLAVVSVADEDKLSLFRLDKRLGQLEFLRDVKVSADAGSQYFDAKRSVLYLGLRNAGRIAVLKLDRENKRLTQIDEVTTDKDPAYLHVDRTGNWLMAAYYATGRISCSRLKDDGSFVNVEKDLRQKGSTQWIDTAPRAHAIVPDRANQFVFVPHTGPNTIFQFRFDSKIGELKLNDPPELKFPSDTGPRHLIQHPRIATVWYAINEQAGSVALLKMDKKAGLLKLEKTVATLPEDFQGPNSCSDLEATPDGRFLYAANRGHDSIALFQIDGGILNRKGIFKTEKTPRQFGITPDQRFLVAAGQGSNKLALFRVAKETGKLVRVQTCQTGKKPWWITIID